MRFKLLLFLLSIAGLSISSCQNMNAEEKFKWTGTVASPQEYPILVYDGAIIANDYTYHFDDIWGTPNRGWGNTGGTMTSTTEQMELPDSLAFTWYSFIEQKFFTGKWPLNKQYISQLFKTGLVDPFTNEKGNYDTFVVGLAPNGKITLWAKGLFRQTEVGSFQAHDTTITKENAPYNMQYLFRDDYISAVFNNNLTVTPEIKQRIKKYGYPDSNIYTTYQNKYTWSPKIELPAGFKIKMIDCNMCNGESLTEGAAFFDSISKMPKAIPYFISLTISDSVGKIYQLEVAFTEQKNYFKDYTLQARTVLPVDFDKSEILQVFQDKIDARKDLFLVLKADPSLNDFAVSLLQEQTNIPLIKNIRETYQFE